MDARSEACAVAWRATSESTGHGARARRGHDGVTFPVGLIVTPCVRDMRDELSAVRQVTRTGVDVESEATGDTCGERWKPAKTA